MPDLVITISDEEHDLLEQIRRHQGLDTIEQAAEWLAKSRLRKNMRTLNGRGRALYIVRKGED